MPGTLDPIKDIAELTDIARKIGFPVILKAVAGGGGKGMRSVERERDLAVRVAGCGLRGAKRVRRRARVPGEISRAAAAHRNPDSRRISMATSFISASANVPCSGGTRK